MHNRRISLVMALLGAIAGFGNPVRIQPQPKLRGAEKPTRSRSHWHGPSWRKPHDGEQEKARRRAQIERGQLTASNGLVRHV